jgi:phage shock protein C
MERRLYRSKKERVLLGVCGGIAEYFNVDPTLIRLIFVLLILVTGPLLPIFYIISALIIPEAPNGVSSNEEKKTEYVDVMRNIKTHEFWGWFLLIIGIFLLLRNLGWFFIPANIVLPIFLLGLGVILLLKSK